MNLTEIKLKELILEMMDAEDEELKELVQKAISKAMETPSPEMFETLLFTIESMGVPLEQVGNYMDPQPIADKIINAVDNNLHEDLGVLFEMLEKRNTNCLRKYLLQLSTKQDVLCTTAFLRAPEITNRSLVVPITKTRAGIE